MTRRSALALVAALGLTTPARAGSYLDRAALLVRHATSEVDYLREHLSDTELASVIQRIARGRVLAAKRMLVPKEVAQAHPHLLLMLESFEQAAAAAARKSTRRALDAIRKGRSEERIFRGVLKQLGWELPRGPR